MTGFCFFLRAIDTHETKYPITSNHVIIDTHETKYPITSNHAIPDTHETKYPVTDSPLDPLIFQVIQPTSSITQPHLLQRLDYNILVLIHSFLCPMDTHRMLILHHSFVTTWSRVIQKHQEPFCILHVDEFQRQILTWLNQAFYHNQLANNHDHCCVKFGDAAQATTLTRSSLNSIRSILVSVIDTKPEIVEHLSFLHDTYPGYLFHNWFLCEIWIATAQTETMALVKQTTQTLAIDVTDTISQVAIHCGVEQHVYHALQVIQEELDAGETDTIALRTRIIAIGQTFDQFRHYLQRVSARRVPDATKILGRHDALLGSITRKIHNLELN